MDRIRLELNYLDLEKNKKSWQIYFVFATENPKNPQEVVVTIVPKEGLIKISKPADNHISFVPEGEGTEGKFILERKMPDDYSVKAQIWVMHSRRKLRKTGDILTEISKTLNSNGQSLLISALGKVNPWITVSNAAIGLIGSGLRKINDKVLGWVAMDEHFNPDGEEDEELDRKNKLSTGFGEIGWSWIVDYEE